jgi:glutaredoxin-like protein NrdH
MDVKVYALSTCPYCRMTRQYLDEHGVKYDLTEVDLLQGDELAKAREEVKSITGGESFPVIVKGEQHVLGFDREAIGKLLGIED